MPPPHAVCVPYPAQGHITPMLNLAKLLHHKGFHITFVNSDFNHRRFLNSLGPSSLDGFHGFRFESIPDGLPPSDENATQNIVSLCASVEINCLSPFLKLLEKLNSSGAPPVSCIVSDSVMSMAFEAGEQIGLPVVFLWTASACSLLGYLHYQNLKEKGVFPLKSADDFANGYLDTPVDWVPGMTKNIRLRDFPSFVRSTDPDDFMFNFAIRETKIMKMGSSIIINTLEELEADVVNAITKLLPPLYSIGPLHLLSRTRITDSGTENRNPVYELGSSLWKEETECLEWLNGKSAATVVYVNFGSITVMTNEQLVEFAWGLAGSGRDFLWIIRPDLVKGQTAVVPPEFLEETKERGLLLGWCPQEVVIRHPAVGGFLTHCGWNSTLESIVAGVPMICWPFFADQQTNCRYICAEWGVGMEFAGDDDVMNMKVTRKEVEGVVKELMEGEKGKKMRKETERWKKIAVEATEPGGSSHVNFDNLVNKLLDLSVNGRNPN